MGVLTGLKLQIGSRKALKRPAGVRVAIGEVESKARVAVVLPGNRELVRLANREAVARERQPHGR